MMNTPSLIRRSPARQRLHFWLCVAIVALHIQTGAVHADDPPDLERVRQYWADLTWDNRGPRLTSGSHLDFAYWDGRQCGTGRQDILFPLADESGPIFYDISTVEGQKCLLVQSDAKTLQLWYGEDYSKRVDVARNIHGVYLGGAVVDPSRNRVITIGCDHVDMNMHSDVMTGAGAVMSMSFAGRPLGDAFRFSDTPTDISRDAYCQYVAVTTSSGGLHVFKNRIAGLEHEWRVNPHVGPTPGVSVSGDGQCVASSGCLGVSCFRLIDGSPVFQVKVDNKPTGSSFVGNEHLCYIIKGELSVIMLSDPSNTKKSMKVDEYVVRMGESSCGHGVVFLVDDGPGEPGRPRRTKVKYLDLQKAGLMEEASK